MKAFGVALCLSVLWGFPALAADPAGHYRVEGNNPGGQGAYRGTVDVTRTGETYRVVWVIGDQRYVGTGIGNEQFLAVTYRSGNDTGLAIYGERGDGWAGPWTTAGGTSVGAESWTRQ